MKRKKKRRSVDLKGTLMREREREREREIERRCLIDL